jgi:hypothetical protein
MKKRMGYISNSSSSSFIISTKSSNEKIKVEIDLLEFIENCGDYDSSGISFILKTENDILKYIKEYYCYDSIEEFIEDDEDHQEKINEMKQQINEGNIIICCDIGYDKTSQFEVLKKCKQIKFIKEEW